MKGCMSQRVQVVTMGNATPSAAIANREDMGEKSVHGQRSVSQSVYYCRLIVY